MKLIYTGLSAVCLASALLLSAPVFANTGTDQDAVTSKGDQTVVSTDGACVRTKWQSSTDVCARPVPVKKIVQAPAPAPRIELEQRTVYFDFNKSELTSAEVAKLDKLVDIIAHSKSITHATVVGYTDDIGSQSYNMKLSQKRAAAVEQYLASRVSIPTSVLMVSGKGDADPVTTCSPKMKHKERIACLAQNRRVEIKFDYME